MSDFLPATVTDEAHRNALMDQLKKMGSNYTESLMVVETTMKAVDKAVEAFEKVIDNALYLDIGMQANVLAAQLARIEFTRRADVAVTICREHMPSREVIRKFIRPGDTLPISILTPKGPR